MREVVGAGKGSSGFTYRQKPEVLGLLVRVTIGVIKHHEQKKVTERSIFFFFMLSLKSSLKRLGQKLGPETQTGYRPEHRTGENA